MTSCRLPLQQRILAIEVKVILTYINCVTGVKCRIYLDLRCRGLHWWDTNKNCRFCDFTVSALPQMLQEKRIKIILTHSCIYVCVFLYSYSLLHTLIS
jgi:hypothetical protein